MSKIIPVTAWAALRKKGNEIPLHSHDYYEMVFYETGMGYGSVGGERYRFSSGKLLLIPPGNSARRISRKRRASDMYRLPYRFRDSDRIVCGCEQKN